VKKILIVLTIIMATSSLVFSSYKVSAFSSYNNNPVNSFTASATSSSDKCDQSLWKYIAHPARLKVLNPCVTVSGVVTLVHFAPDGDTVFALKLDPQYKNMVNKANFFNPKMKGGIWVELICQRPNKSHESKHRGDCENYNGPKFPTPKVGQYLRVTGSHVQDNGEDGHLEIHPTTSIIKLTKMAFYRSLVPSTLQGQYI
jgi:hypothetical protein